MPPPTVYPGRGYVLAEVNFPTIVNGKIELTSSVAAPKRVRYMFSGTGNLFNSVSIPVEGGANVTRLPASLFEWTIP
jgi:hypothetical protein